MSLHCAVEQHAATDSPGARDPAPRPTSAPGPCAFRSVVGSAGPAAGSSVAPSAGHGRPGAAHGPALPLVHTLQRELIPQLARRHRADATRLGSSELEAFTRLVLDGDEPALLARLELLRRRGFGVDTLCLELLAPCAQALGALWSDDRCDFASVTIAVSLLQRLMRLMGGAWPSPPVPSPGYRALLLRPPQEQHSFGLAMVAEFFRQAGWSVSAGSDDDRDTPATRARVQHFDLVGLSIGTEVQLPWLAQQVSELRRASRNRQLVILLGGPLAALQPQRLQALGADLCLASAREAAVRAAACVEARRAAA